jgi:hypothetical protein
VTQLDHEALACILGMLAIGVWFMAIGCGIHFSNTLRRGH